MVKAHWEYVEKLLRVHGEKEEVITKIGFHYRSALEHGIKHGVELEKEKELTKR